MFQVRLVAYQCPADGGAALGALPDVRQFSCNMALNDIGSLEFNYPKSGRRIEWLLGKYFEIAVEYDVGNGFFEPPNARYIFVGRTDDVTEYAGDYVFRLQGYASNLRHSLVWGLLQLNEDGDRDLSGTPGAIMSLLINEAKNAGGLSGLTYSFTPTLDTNVQTWAKVFPKISFDPANDDLTILRNLADQGCLDWVMFKRRLDIYNPDLFLNQQKPNVNIPRSQLMEAPNEVASDELVHTIYVQGEGFNREIMQQASTTPKPWGTWAKAVQAGGIEDKGLLRLFGDAALKAGARDITQLTRAFDPRKTAFFPWADYGLGDSITVPGTDGQGVVARVRQISLKQDSEGRLVCILTLNDRIQEASIRAARRVNAIAGGGGAGSVPGGTGAIPDRQNDTRKPLAPTNLRAGSTAYIDEQGWARGTATLIWDPVGKATDGTDIQIQEYEVWRKPFDDEWQRHTVVGNQSTSATISPLEVTTNVQLGVRAIAYGSNRVASDFSTVTIKVANDDEPPPVPSALQVKGNRGALTVTWNGLDSTGQAMPLDFGSLRIHRGTTESFTPAAGNLFDTLTAAGSAVYADGTTGTSYYFKAVAVDRAGNKSAPSQATVGTVGNFLADEVLNGANLIDLSVDGTKALAAGSLDASRLRVGQVNLITDPGLKDAELTNYRLTQATRPAGIAIASANNLTSVARITSSSSEATEFFLTVPAAPNKYAAMPVTPGEKYYIAVRVDIANTPSPAPKIRLTYQTTSGGLVVADLGSVTASGLLVYDWDAPSDAMAVTLLVRHEPGSGLVLYRSFDFRRKVPGVLIEEGAVTADKIAANAVTAGKILAETITGNKLAATAIDGKTITGSILRTSANLPRIQIDGTSLKQLNVNGVALSELTPTGFKFRSATSGARVEISNSGIQGFKASGQPAFSFLSGSGDAEINGVFRSNSPNLYPRIEIDNSLWINNFMGVRFYANGSLQTHPELRVETTSGFLTIASGELFGFNSSAPTGKGELNLYSGSTKSGWSEGFLLTSRKGQGDPFGGRVEGNPTALFLNGPSVVLSSDNGTAGSLRLAQNGSLCMEISGDKRTKFYSWVQLNNRPAITSGVTLGLPTSGDPVISYFSSLSRFKLDQRPVPLDYRFLNIEPITWIDRNAAEADPTNTTRAAGFIAEQVEEVSVNADNAFHSLLVYDQEGDLQALQYDRFPAYLFPIVKDIHRRETHSEQLIEQLLQRVAQLESALEAQ